MVEYTTMIKRFDQQGEKTGWTYIDVPEVIAQQLKPGNKKSFRVKGRFDEYVFEGVALIPMGGGDFIIPLNALVRKAIGKTKGASLKVTIEVDPNPLLICPELIECLADEPAALAYFNKLPGSHQKYFSKWIESAKTEVTKTKRIAQTVMACARQMGYGEMIRWLKEEKNELLRG